MREHPEVRAVLPQRYPLLLVDRVVDVEPGRWIRTVKAVTGTDPCYASVPDGAPDWCYDYPRSMIVESFGQSAALLWLAGSVGEGTDGQPAGAEGAPPDQGPAATGDDRLLMFVGAGDFRFEGAARPGDVLRHEVWLDSVIADTAFASGETWVGDRRVASVDRLVATRRSVRPPAPPPVPPPANR